MREVKLYTPTRRPLLFCYVKGWLSVLPNAIGVLVPILDQTSPKVNIRVKNKEGIMSRDEVWVPYTMIVLSADVQFELSASMIVLLYTHPTLPVLAVQGRVP